MTKIAYCAPDNISLGQEIAPRSLVRFWTHDGHMITIRMTDDEDGIVVMSPRTLVVHPQGLNRIEVKTTCV